MVNNDSLIFHRYYPGKLVDLVCVQPGSSRALCVSPNASTRGGVIDYFLYAGTYTEEASDGIYVARFSATTGELGSATLAAEIENPSFLCVHPNNRFLYAVSEVPRSGGLGTGCLCSWAIDPSTGKLRPIGRVESFGKGPCHGSLDRTGALIFVSNYGDGSIAAFRALPDGGLGERTAFQPNSGSSIHLPRQARAHPHGVFPCPQNCCAVVPDLGADAIFLYRLDASAGSFTPADPPLIRTAAGFGPRRFVFHPDGRFGYALGELQSMIVGYEWQPRTCSLKATNRRSTIEQCFTGVNLAAEIAIDRDGRFLYCSNRGADDLAVFAIRSDYELDLVQRIETAGKTPRHFALDPTENFLIVANQESDEAVVFARDRNTGLLKLTHARETIPSPACIAFARSHRATGLSTEKTVSREGKWRCSQ